ncbi:hypothetical protein [Actinoplanes utahensis]|uniref:Uncharacterized protein n=1 Tax=Actinoplanes utahensis TaxID=1869 RepID=A0A0A6U8C7_ACTUT|nr:hypothetical protein [Actinoplanes utahensis]KHD72275.1 hypothetical protein MB27_41200 [Actinoplanes utahensis]
MRNSRERAPAAVRAAFGSWLVAVGAGVFETCSVVAREGLTGDVVGGAAVRTAVFVVAVAVAWQMRAGRRWARLTLAVGLGVVGLASLVADPIAWLAAGNAVPRLIADSGAADLAFGVSRGVHIVAVLIGVTLMFTPSANAWFRVPVPARA